MKPESAWFLAAVGSVCYPGITKSPRLQDDKQPVLALKVGWLSLMEGLAPTLLLVTP